MQDDRLISHYIVRQTERTSRVRDIIPKPTELKLKIK